MRKRPDRFGASVTIVACECYHPLFCFNQFGDVERALLRKGNVHSADDWQAVLEPVVARYRGQEILRFFPGDARSGAEMTAAGRETKDQRGGQRTRSAKALQNAPPGAHGRGIGHRPDGSVRVWPPGIRLPEVQSVVES